MLELVLKLRKLVFEEAQRFSFTLALFTFASRDSAARVRLFTTALNRTLPTLDSTSTM